MTKMRKFLALVLVMAMTFTMLPVFAAADEIAAVQTVDAPAAEAPAAEPVAEAAPAAAPAERVAVEEVAEISAAPAEAAPVAEAIETVAAETVAPTAELQTVSDSDHAKVVMLAGANVGQETGYATIAAAYEAAGQCTDLCEVVVLKDVSYYITSNAYNTGALNGSASTKATYKTWNVENTSDPAVTVHGFWLNLNGHTVTVNCQVSSSGTTGKYRPALYTLNAPVNVKGGTIVYKYSRTNVTEQFGVVMMGYGSSSGNSCEVGDASEVYAPEITLKGVNAYRLKAPEYSTSGPVIAGVLLGSDIKIIDSTIVSQNGAAIKLAKHTYKTTVPASATAEHNLYVKDSTLGSTNTAGTASSSTSAIMAMSISGGASVPCDLNVTFEGTVHTFGKANPFDVAAEGPTLYFNAETNYAASTTTLAIPDASTLSKTNNDLMTPGDLAEGSFTGRTYTVISDCTHATKSYVATAPATFAAAGMTEHYVCDDCGQVFEMDETTETTAAALSIAQLSPADAAGKTEAQLVELDAVALSVAPDGTPNAYTTLEPAFNDAKEWTLGGGTVKLLQDYAYQNTSTHINTGCLLTVKNRTTDYKSWNQTNTTDPEKTVNGFWFDLGGHTLTAKVNGAMFYVNESCPFNMKNGTIIMQNLTTVSADYVVGSVIQCGNPAGSYVQAVRNADHVFHPEITLKDVNLYSSSATEAKTSSGIAICDLYSTVNLINTSIFAKSYAVVYIRTTFTPGSGVDELDAYPAVTEERHVLNISTTGDKHSVLGSVNSGPVYIATHGWPTTGADGTNWNLPEDHNYRSLNIYTSGNENIEFFGTDPFIKTGQSNASAASMDYKINGTAVPGLFGDKTGSYSFSQPDWTTIDTAIAAGTGASAVAGRQAAVTKTTNVYSAPTPGVASFNGGAAEGLDEAAQEWIDAGYTGTITLNASPSTGDIAMLQSVAGGMEYVCTTTSESDASNFKILVPAAAVGGDLTLDLNGYTINSNTLIATHPDLSGFALRIQDGTINSNGYAIQLKGSGIRFYLDNMTLASTSGNIMQDCRGDNSYSILTNSTISSTNRGVISVFNYSGNSSATDPILYYIKDCNLLGSYSGTTKQQVIYGGGVNDLPDRQHVLVIDGDCTLAAAHAYGQIFAGLDPVTGDFIAERKNVYFIAPHGEFTGPVDGVYSTTTDASASKLCDAADAQATVTVGSDLTLPFADYKEALKFASYFGKGGILDVTVTLNEDVVVTESTPIGPDNTILDTYFTIALNGKTISDDDGCGLIALQGTEADSTVNVNVTGAFGDSATSAKFFEGVPALAYTSGSRYIGEKGRYFSEYSLNLEDSVKINLYTDGVNGDPDFVSYLQDGATYTVATPGAVHDWVVGSLAAKQMSETIDAYAVKASGTTTYVDFSKNISVKGYVDTDPASKLTGDVATTLDQTLKTMMIYGKYAEKFFGTDSSEITADELTEIGVDAVPDVDTTGLDDSAFAITGIGNHQTDSSVTDGYYGSAAVLQDKIALKFYFFGAAFASGATVQIGEAAPVAATSLDSVDGNFKYVEASVAAKDFDTAITVAFDGIGSVTDSVSAYTSRLIAGGSDATNLANALRAYGASAKAYSAAKIAAGV